MHSLVMGLVMHSLGSSLFLQCKLLGSKTDGKTSAETKLLGNVPTNHCTSKTSKEGPFLPDTNICSHFSTFSSPDVVLIHLNLFINVLNALFFRRPLPLLILGLLLMMNLDLNGVTFFLLFHPTL